jgi:hypothetical protein
MLERPRMGGVETPSRMGLKLILRPSEETGVVGPQGEPGAGLGAVGEGLEEFCLEQAALEMAGFGPGVGEKDKNATQADMGWHGSQGLNYISIKEGDVFELQAVLFTLGAFDAFFDKVDSQAGD